MSFKDTDKGFNALFGRIKGAKPVVLTVGIHDAEGSMPDGNGSATIAEVGTFHEFGIGVPQRSFIRAWADENEAKNQDTLRKIGANILKTGGDPIQGLNRAGVRFVAEIQGRMVAGIDPENAASTIRQKGSSTPLIDTGQLKSSITYKIEAA